MLMVLQNDLMENRKIKGSKAAEICGLVMHFQEQMDNHINIYDRMHYGGITICQQYMHNYLKDLKNKLIGVKIKSGNREMKFLDLNCHTDLMMLSDTSKIRD